MTLLLASVTGPDEAALVLAHGADIIDLKDASNGALGALAPDVVRATVAAVRGRRPVSAVSGDLPMEPQVVAAAVGIMARTGVDYVKVGLFPGLGREQCVRALAPLARTSKIIGVMFADCGADNALVQLMADCGFVGAMLDTADKRAGRLLDCMDAASLRNFVSTCRDHGLMTGLQDRWSARRPTAAPSGAGSVGFRGALSSGATPAPHRSGLGRHHSRAHPFDPQAAPPRRTLPWRRSTIGCWRRDISSIRPAVTSRRPRLRPRSSHRIRALRASACEADPFDIDVKVRPVAIPWNMRTCSPTM